MLNKPYPQKPHPRTNFTSFPWPQRPLPYSPPAKMHDNLQALQNNWRQLQQSEGAMEGLSHDAHAALAASRLRRRRPKRKTVVFGKDIALAQGGQQRDTRAWWRKWWKSHADVHAVGAVPCPWRRGVCPGNGVQEVDAQVL